MRSPSAHGAVIAVALGIMAAPLGACEEKAPPAPVAPAPPAPAPSPPPVEAAAAAEPVPSASASAAPAASTTAAPESVAAQHVLVAWKGAKNAPRTVTRSKSEAKKRADEVAAKARSGEDFSALVDEYTDDEATKDRRGNLGKFTKEKMISAVADAAFALSVGEVSAPVATSFGYHVIKRNQ